MGNSTSERRRFPRIACREVVRYRDLLKPSAALLGGLTKDLSMGGVRFETAECFPCRTRVLVELVLSGRTAAPIRTIAQVVWVQKQAHSDQYEAGAQFVEMQPQDRQALAGHLQQLLPSASS